MTRMAARRLVHFLWRMERDIAVIQPNRLDRKNSQTFDDLVAWLGHEGWLAIAKLYATDRAQDEIDKALQLHGGDGVRREHIAERLYSKIRALPICESASDVQKVVIAREKFAG